MEKLAKSLSLWQALGVAIGLVVGSGLLALPGLALQIGGLETTALGWLVSIAMAIPLIAIFYRLALKFPTAAGLSHYAEVAFGKWARFAVTFILLGSFVLGMPVLVLIGGAYVQQLLGWSEATVPFIGLGIVTFITIINFLETRASTVVNLVASFLLILLMAGVTGFNLDYFQAGLPIFLDSSTNLEINKLWTVCALLFWAFIGWENLSFCVEELKNPEKNVKKVYWLSFFFVSVLYLALAITMIGAQKMGLSVANSAGVALLAHQVPFGKLLILIMVLVILANTNSWMFSISRFIFSAGREHILPQFFGTLSQKKVPSRSLIPMLMVTIVVIICTEWWDIKVSDLILLVNQNFLILYAASIFAYWKIERKSFSKWLIAGSALLSLGFLFSGFGWSLLFPITLIVIGFGVYTLRRK